MVKLNRLLDEEIFNDKNSQRIFKQINFSLKRPPTHYCDWPDSDKLSFIQIGQALVNYVSCGRGYTFYNLKNPSNSLNRSCRESVQFHLLRLNLLGIINNFGELGSKNNPMNLKDHDYFSKKKSELYELLDNLKNQDLDKLMEFYKDFINADSCRLVTKMKENVFEQIFDFNWALEKTRLLYIKNKRQKLGEKVPSGSQKLTTEFDYDIIKDFL